MLFLIQIISVCSLLLCACEADSGASSLSWQVDFHKIVENNPILTPLRETQWKCPIRNALIRWEEKDVFNPAAVVRDNKVYLLYRAEDTLGSHAGTSRIGIASSEDGIHFTRSSHPVLYPDTASPFEWDGGCEDPRVVSHPDGGYIMTYTSYDGTARLSIATSEDLLTWIKHGPAFSDEKYRNAWTKSGSIIASPQSDGSLVAVKIQEKYWMYWGENHIHAATSEDLIHWTPVFSDENELYRGRPDHQDIATGARKPLSLLTPRKGKFDSELVEPGPPAILRPDGIFFIYNSKNLHCRRGMSNCDPSESYHKLPPGTYSAGQALFSREDPTKLLFRSPIPFFSPSEPFEITGQVGNVCFLEGLVYFKDRWLLYYGTADSKIAVAEAVGYTYEGMEKSSLQVEDFIVSCMCCIGSVIGLIAVIYVVRTWDCIRRFKLSFVRTSGKDVLL